MVSPAKNLSIMLGHVQVSWIDMYMYTLYGTAIVCASLAGYIHVHVLVHVHVHVSDNNSFVLLNECNLPALMYWPL